MNKYQDNKEKIIQEAIEWQDYFYKKAKRYGLIREFRENCII